MIKVQDSLNTISSLAPYSYIRVTYHLTTLHLAGYYIYIESSGRRKGDNAIISTPFVDKSGPRCEIGFWYHMLGTKMGHLTVWMMQNGVKTQLLKKSFDLGANVWFEGGAFIGAQTNFSIMIEGKIYSFNHCTFPETLHSSC